MANEQTQKPRTTISLKRCFSKTTLKHIKEISELGKLADEFLSLDDTYGKVNPYILQNIIYHRLWTVYANLILDELNNERNINQYKDLEYKHYKSKEELNND